MREVNVKREELLKTVRANRDEHVATFEEAMRGYRVTITEKLEDALAALDDGKEIPDLRAIAFTEKPASHEREYEQAIQMLEWSEDEVVKLDNNSFAQLVQDEWSWKEGFETMASTYMGR